MTGPDFPACPICESDDYTYITTDWIDTDQPDNDVKRCEECGEEWT